jgi:hypothetical protein
MLPTNQSVSLYEYRSQQSGSKLFAKRSPGIENIGSFTILYKDHFTWIHENPSGYFSMSYDYQLKFKRIVSYKIQYVKYQF